MTIRCFKALVSLPLSGDQKPWDLMNRMLALHHDNLNMIFSFEDCSSNVYRLMSNLIYFVRRYLFLEL